MARHGGGAFSGKDPSKVDRSAAYAGRYVAKNIVAAGLADRCQVQLAYAIGVAEPVSVSIDSFGTGRISDAADLRRDRVSGASETNAYLPDGPVSVAHPTSHSNCLVSLVTLQSTYDRKLQEQETQTPVREGRSKRHRRHNAEPC